MVRSIFDKPEITSAWRAFPHEPGCRPRSTFKPYWTTRQCAGRPDLGHRPTVAVCPKNGRDPITPRCAPASPRSKRCRKLAQLNPKFTILVLCGHTHGGGEVQVAEHCASPASVCGLSIVSCSGSPFRLPPSALRLPPSPHCPSGVLRRTGGKLSLPEHKTPRVFPRVTQTREESGIVEKCPLSGLGCPAGCRLR